MLGLGIDTGGTYTDAVLYDYNARAVTAWAKALTTRFDLSAGITEALRGLPPQKLRLVSQVSLSSTLATNACVEGKGAQAALVLLGYDADLFRELCPEYGLKPGPEVLFLPGRHGQHGEEISAPPWDELRALVGEAGGSVEAFGVAEYWGVRNPAYELRAREIIAGETGLPVVCAHELSAELNSLRRAVTTLLNARLIPLSARLLAAVKSSLDALGVEAPLSVVRGDGSLMAEEFARLHPVETLLSGPAASVIGGTTLSGLDDAVVIDMGGTTTDAALVLGGRAAAAPDGAEIAGWATGTKAVSVHTTGLGGDSRIGADGACRLSIGPERVAPLAWLAWRHPGALPAMARAARKGRSAEFVLAAAGRRPAGLTQDEDRLLDLVQEQGPLDLEHLAELMHTYAPLLPTKRLEAWGLLLFSALTPTDLLHVEGEFTAWSAEAARAGAEAFAAEHGLEARSLPALAKEAMARRLFGLAVRAILAHERRGAKKPAPGAELLAEAFEPGTARLSLHARTDLPLVALGAPIGHYLPRVAAALGTRMVQPPEAAVASAVGAAAARIMVAVEIKILPDGGAGFSVHSPAGCRRFALYNEALAHAREHGRELARGGLLRRGAAEPMEIEIEVAENVAQAGGPAAAPVFLETAVLCTGRALPARESPR
ncbi:MAG: hydantoinase/oxoprolinase family protein [Patescibacteria group bacterium]